MILGMTGNREGISAAAKITFLEFLDKHQHAIKEFHHGDCLGADADAHAVASEHKLKIVIHPPNQDKDRAFCKGDVILTPKPYLARNKKIVFASNQLVAFPPTTNEILRSGTWSTIRYARKRKIPILLIFKDGSSKAEQKN